MMKVSGLCLVAALAAGGLAACGQKKAATRAEQPLSASFDVVALKPMQGGLSASGLLVPREEAAVTTELSGYRVAQVLVDQGAVVSAGQPLVKLDDTLLKAQIAQSEAALAAQEASVARADAEAKRVAGLDNQGVLAQEQIDARRIAARSAQAQMAAAKAQLADLRVREGLMTVRAPVAGRILARSVRPGDIAGPSLVMFRMARDGQVEVNAEAPESRLGDIHAGDKAQVELADGRKVEGVVRLVSPELDVNTRLGHVRVTLPVRDDIRAGGFARVQFVTKAVDIAAVPESAVHFDADGASVLVIGPDSRVKKATVKTGQRADGFVALNEGPPLGSRVVLGGAAFLLDGDRVNPVPAQAARR
jgi:HlyD family secretion protein